MSKKFTFQQVENDPTMQKFLKKKSGREQATIESYVYTLLDFCNFTGKSPTEIHDLHREDLRKRVAEFDMWLNNAFDDYIFHLIDSNKLYGTINLRITRIKGFLHAFKLKPTPIPDIPKKHVREDSKYALSVEDIMKAVRNSKPTYQTLFITQAQTGLSVSDALLLDVEDFVSAVSKKGENLTVKEAISRVKNQDNIIGCFDLRRKKTSVEFYTFVGPEALRSIASLLEARDEEYLKHDSPIFIKELKRLSKSRAELIQDVRLNRHAVQNYVDRMHKVRGIFPKIKVDGKEKNYFRTHKIRKWFSNELRFKAGFSSDDVKYLMGQKTGDVLEQYINPNNYNALKGNYRRALPYLAVIDEIKLEENKEAIEKLENENRMLKSIYENDSKEKDEKIAKMEKQIELIEELLGDKEFAKNRI